MKRQNMYISIRFPDGDDYPKATVGMAETLDEALAMT